MTEKSGIDPVYPYIENKVKTLKGQITKLRNRIETLEISGLQEQITKLDDDFKSINKSIIDVGRVVAFNEMDALNLHMRKAIRLTLSKDDQKHASLKEYISTEHAKAAEKVLNSPTPIAVLMAFKQECIKCSEKYDLGAFESKPY